MPSTDLSGFGKAMFEKRMRERNMGMDPFGNPKGPMMPTEPGLNEVQRDRLQEIMETTRTEGQPFGSRFKDAIKGFSGVEKGMGVGAIGAGFDNSALMQDPKFKQEDTMNQGMAVSEPYEEANEKAFEKNNPMNAISQETPVGDKVSAFLKLMGR
tara:strand:- start:41 stop:505 length:465 start_codon:yes stop_codon:yes gene_type:complete